MNPFVYVLCYKSIYICAIKQIVLNIQMSRNVSILQNMTWSWIFCAAITADLQLLLLLFGTLKPSLKFND